MYLEAGHEVPPGEVLDQDIRVGGAQHHCVAGVQLVVRPVHLRAVGHVVHTHVHVLAQPEHLGCNDCHNSK